MLRCLFLVWVCVFWILPLASLPRWCGGLDYVLLEELGQLGSQCWSRAGSFLNIYFLNILILGVASWLHLLWCALLGRHDMVLARVIEYSGAEAVIRREAAVSPSVTFDAQLLSGRRRQIPRASQGLGARAWRVLQSLCVSPSSFRVAQSECAAEQTCLLSHAVN